MNDDESMPSLSTPRNENMSQEYQNENGKKQVDMLSLNYDLLAEI
jgi:hypothetical protein